MRDVLHQFDTAITTFVTNWPPDLVTLFTVVTWIGWPVITVALSGCIVLYGGLSRNLRLALSGIIALCALGVGVLIKHLVGRERPLEEYATGPQVDGLNMSFPSGHSISALVVYGLLAYLLAKLLPKPWGTVVAALLSVLILLICVSRIYLRAHFPSDVLAGALIGGAALLVIVLYVKPRLQKR